MEPFRVLHVFASLDRGGAETMIMNIYRNIDRTKIQFDFVVNERNKEYAYESEIKKLGGKIYKLPRFNISNYITYQKAWEKLISQHPEWTIVHGHHTSTGFIYLRIANALNRLTIAHSHIAGSEKTMKSYIKVIMRYPLRYVANHLFACSKLAAKWMYGPKGNSAKIINNAIDASQFTFDDAIRKVKRKELGLEDNFVVGHIGRFQTQKNHEYLIDIFKEVYSKNSKAILLLIGDGNLRQSIEKKVEDLGLSNNVIFTGVRTDIPDLLKVMDVFVFPSLYEGLPVTLVEAQAASLPCIVSDNITKEVGITNLVKYVSLRSPVNNWVEEIINNKDILNRRNMYNEISDSGYNLQDNVASLQEFYFSVYK